MGLWSLPILCLLVILWTISEGARLSEYVQHYESLKYDADHIYKQHERVRRSLLPDRSEVGIKFDSHGKSFHLRLKRDTTTISRFVKVEMPAHLGTLDTAHIYDGVLADEPTARVWGSIQEGVFEGVIDSKRKGTYYVERADKYFPRHNATRAGFHSVIYHDDNVEDPYAGLRQGHASGCGMTNKVAAKMESMQDSATPCDTNHVAEDEDMPEQYHQMARNLGMHKLADNHMYKQRYKSLHEQLRKDFSQKYSSNGNHTRKKRALFGVGAKNKGTCTLSIQTDPMLWHVLHGNEGKNPVKTKDEITALISQHVKAINNIYGDVIFEGRYKHQGIRFEVQRIKIDDDSSCGSNGEGNTFCKRNVDVSNFLNLHSQTNHDDFCLSYVFTFRDFTGGTLGLAWVASPSGASGGICEKYKTYTENLAGSRHTEQRSLNTGIITFLNYNSRVPPKVSQLTLAHEIGHNFGSPHDYPEVCKPGGLKGNYIMFSSATSGDRPNNSKFSPCSVRNITKVLDAIIENRRKNCFQESDGAFCGNKIVEEGEECDCGYDAKECDEQCCYPKLLDDRDRQLNSSAQPCTRRANTQCSPSEGPCCNRHTCQFLSGLQCHTESDCTDSSKCNGYRATCPAPSAKPNLTYCHENTKVCISGECTGSICLAHNMNECFLTSDKVQDKKELCEIACKRGPNTTQCSSTSDLAHVFRAPVFMRPGAPCNNFQGYCDVFQKCRAVDAEGPLARLKNLLFSEDTLNSLAEWVTEYWYAVLLIGVAFVVVMGMFIKCCAVHTPSNNPNKPAARSISDTLRRPVNTLRRVKRNRTAHGAGPSQGSHPQQQAPSSRNDRHSRNSSQQPMENQPGPSRGQPRQTPRKPQEPVRNSRAYADEPPPPYPGNKPPPTRHGYGEGRGHYNRPRGNRRQENSAV